MACIANLSARMGIISRKKAMQLATETGKKLVDKSNELGRIINKQEIEEVFRQTLPKRCRPEIVTTKEEVFEVLSKSGLTKEQITEFINIPYAAAACLSNGRKKCPIWIPFEKIGTIEALRPYINSFITHELEHALEKNNRIPQIISRKLSGVVKFFGKLFNKDFMQKNFDREMALHNFEQNIQEALACCLDRKLGGFVCESTVDGINNYLKTKTGETLIEKLRSIVRRDYAGAENKGSEVNKRLKWLKYLMEIERPAYFVQGEIERYSGLVVGNHSINEGISRGYEMAIDIASQERRGYWKNKLLGNLKKPNVYSDDSDLFKYANTKKQKQILEKMLGSLDLNQKRGLIKLLYCHENEPEAVEIVSKFIEKTTQNGKNLFLENPNKLKSIKTEKLLNPIFIKIAKLANSDVKNGEMIISLIPFLGKASPLELRIYLGKIQKAIKKEKDVCKIVDQLCYEISSKKNKMFDNIFCLG